MPGIDFRTPELHERANASAVGNQQLPEEVARRVAETYRDIYQFVATRFAVDLGELWPYSHYVS